MTAIRVPGYSAVLSIQCRRGDDGLVRASLCGVVLAEGDTERETLGRAFEFLTAAAAAVLVRR